MDYPEDPNEERRDASGKFKTFKKISYSAVLDRFLRRKNDTGTDQGSSGENNDVSEIGTFSRQTQKEESGNESEDDPGLIDEVESDRKFAELCQISEVLDLMETLDEEENSDSDDNEDNSETDDQNHNENTSESHKSEDAQVHFDDQQFRDIFEDEMRIEEEHILFYPPVQPIASQQRDISDELSWLNLDDLIDDVLNETIQSLDETIDDGTADNKVVVNPIKQLPQMKTEERYLRRVFFEEIKPFRCPLCLEDKPLEDSESFGCSHLICKGCLVNFFTSKIDDGQVIDIECPAEDCTTIAEGLLIKSLVSFGKTIRYDELLLKNAIDTMDFIINCPKCNRPVECDLGTGEGNCIDCSHAFCTSCLKDFHGMDDCAEVQNRLQDNVRSEDFIRQNLKMCPGCKTNIEKDIIGCNHMTCAKCKTEFCWLCLDKLTNDKKEFERHYSKCVLFDHQFVD